MLAVILFSILISNTFPIKLLVPDQMIDELVWFETPSRHELMMNGIMKHLTEARTSKVKLKQNIEQHLSHSVAIEMGKQHRDSNLV